MKWGLLNRKRLIVLMRGGVHSHSRNVWKIPVYCVFQFSSASIMQITAQEFADLVTQALQDPERLGSDASFGVTLLRVGSGYHLRPVGETPSTFIHECYRIIYSLYQPTSTVVPPPL